MDKSKVTGSAYLSFKTAVKRAFDSEGSDKTANQHRGDWGHAYQDTYAAQFIRLYARRMEGFPVIVGEVGLYSGASVRAMRRIIPFATIFGFDKNKCGGYLAGAIEVIGDGYDGKTWSCLPRDFDLIIDDGSHNVEDILRGIPVFTEHLRPGGILLIEDLQRDDIVEAVMSHLPGSEVVDTRDIGKYDDRIILYEKPPVCQREPGAGGDGHG